MFLKLKYIVLFVLISTSAVAQREAANWYFGVKAGLDFNSGTPVPLLDGELDTVEGCESISTADGQLRFYTDGITVWNRLHQVMPNGTELFGSVSATQSALAVPKPGSTNIYYVFTADAVQNYQNGGNGRGFNYSVVDMSANGGLGDVIQKNLNLLPNGSEKVSAVSIDGSDDYWVVTHYKNKFYAYKITSSGISPNPKISTLGPQIDRSENIRGAIKFSPRGDQIIVAHFIEKPSLGGFLYLYDFDIDTGDLSNQLLLNDELLFYGVEFSSNSSKVYASAKTIDPTNGESDNIQILQYDLDEVDIPSSEKVISDTSNLLPGDLAGTLQIAVDKKIYHSIPSRNLSVINSPNLVGFDADYRQYVIDLGDRATKFGLPPFVQSFFESVIRIENFCLGQATEFFIDSEDPIDSISWNFGDPASGGNNTSNLLEPTHVFSSTGVFTVTIDVDFTDRPSQQFVEFVEISSSPIVNSDVSLVQCDIDGTDDGIAQFNLNEAIPNLLVNPIGFTANFFVDLADAVNNENRVEPIGYENTANNQVIYARVFDNAACFEIVPVELIVQSASDAGTQNISVCNSSSNPLNIEIQLSELESVVRETYPTGDIQFYETKESALFELEVLVDVYASGPFATPEVYFRIENDNECAIIGHLLLDVRQSPIIEDATIELCPNQASISLSPGPGFVSYEWSTGEMTESIDVMQPGIYEVTVTNGTNCSDTAVYTVERVQVPADLQIIVSDFSENNTITIDGLSSDTYTFTIDEGESFQNSNVFENLAVGFYLVQVWEGNCLIYEESVLIGGPPNFFTPNNDSYHDYWQIVAREQLGDAKIYIFDRYGKLLKQLSPWSEGWDGTFMGRPMPATDYWYRIELGDGRMVNGNFSLIR